jgi:hypothetical protein
MKRSLTVVSGGQTGVDRAALDAALELGFPVDGWCPRGRLAEDGTIPRHYGLRETDSAQHAHRTRLNVRDSEGTLILARGRIEGGTRLCLEAARELGRPIYIVTLPDASLPEVVEWISDHRIQRLNIAGPRESESSGIYAAARIFLLKMLAVIDAE